MIKTVIGTIGGVGTSTIARAWAKETSGLLIEGSNRTRVQDLMLEEQLDHIYDYYDLLVGKSIDIVAIKTKDYHLVQGNIFHDLSEIELNLFKEIILALPYDEIVVDLSRHRTEDIMYWAEVSDVFYIVANGTKAAIREYERIQYILRKHRLRISVQLIFNRLDLGEAEKLKKENLVDEDTLQSAYFIENSNHPEFQLQENTVARRRQGEGKRRFWDIFRV